MTKAKAHAAGAARNKMILPLLAASAVAALMALSAPAFAQPAHGQHQGGVKVEKQVKVTKTMQVADRRGDRDDRRYDSRRNDNRYDRNRNTNRYQPQYNDRNRYDNRNRHDNRTRYDRRYESRYNNHYYDRRIITRNAQRYYGYNGYYTPQYNWRAPVRWRNVPGRIVSVGMGRYSNCFTVLQDSYWNRRPALVTVQYCDRGYGVPYVVPGTRSFVQFTYNTWYSW